jgi:uncharacterized protein (DUF427 family)
VDAGFATNGKPIESVWDFPRPPRVEHVDWRIRVVHAGATVVDAPSALRVLETSQPPAHYVAPEHVALDHLRPAEHRQTFCEWKGVASYADIVVADVGGDPGHGVVAEAAAWTYVEPTSPFAAIAGWWAFYAQRVDECWVDDERVAPNPGTFYGGWITANVTGPFKGGPGTSHW